MSSKPELLYLSPVVPALAGNGFAMRAGMGFEALAQHYSISLLVVSLYPPFGARVPAAFERLCLRTVVTTRAQFARTRVSFLPPFLSRLFGWRPYHGSRFDVVHVFRLSMMDYARPFLNVSSGTPKGHLDLDDIESETHRRIAALCRLNKDGPQAAYYEMEARRYEALEKEMLREFDRVYVCSEGDKAKLRTDYESDLRILPNAVRIPVAVREQVCDDNFTFLFVGTLG